MDSHLSCPCCGAELILKTRYPEKFGTWESANRDLQAERRALEEIHAGLPRAEVIPDPTTGRTATPRTADGKAVVGEVEVKPETPDPTVEEVARREADKEALKANLGYCLEQEVQAELARLADANRQIGKEIADALNHHRHAKPVSESLPTAEKVGESVVSGGPSGDWLCACWDGTKGVHVNPPYDLQCGRCGCKRNLALHGYPTRQEFEAELAARNSPLLRQPGTWVCDGCGQVVDGGHAQCVYCNRPRSDTLPGARPDPSHEWLEPDRPQTKCRKCGAYRHLLSGYFRCRPTAPEQPAVAVPESREQDGHGWAQPPASEEEGGKN